MKVFYFYFRKFIKSQLNFNSKTKELNSECLNLALKKYFKELVDRENKFNKFQQLDSLLKRLEENAIIDSSQEESESASNEIDSNGFERKRKAKHFFIGKRNF